MNVTRAGFAEKSPLSINYEESVLYCIRLCVIWPCLIWHFSSAAFGYAASYFVSNTYWQLVPQHIISANVNRGTAAGIKHEATEKLYERHYLVIKIVSSFFACLIKFLYL